MYMYSAAICSYSHVLISCVCLLVELPVFSCIPPYIPSSIILLLGNHLFIRVGFLYNYVTCMFNWQCLITH